MYLWLILCGVILIIYLIWPLPVEHFTTSDLPTLIAQRQQLQMEGERRYNNLARLQTTGGISADRLNAAVQQSIPVPSTHSASLLGMLGSSLGLGGADDGSNKQGASVEQTGVLQSKINFCESLTTINCDLLNDPRLAECGFCHRDGKDSSGKAHRGGLFISSDDQIRTNEAAAASGASRANYKPTIGSCRPENFTLVKERCQARELQMVCQTAGAATSANQCGQCFGSASSGSTGLLFVGPKPRQYTATLWVSHPGGLSNGGVGLVVKQANGTVTTLPYSNRTLLDPAQLTLQITEGDNLSITVYGMPAVWCGWLSNTDGSRTVSLDVGEQSITPAASFTIAGDSLSSVVTKAIPASDSSIWASFQNQVPRSVLWYQRRSGPGLVTSAWYGSTLPDSNGNGPGLYVTNYVKMAIGQGQDITVSPDTLQVSDPVPNTTKYLWVWSDLGDVQAWFDGEICYNNRLFNSMQMAFTVPATLVDPIIAEDKALCPSGPLVFTEVGSGLMGAHSCVTADGSLNPSLTCIQELFQAAGGTAKGSAYPTSDAGATALVVNDPTTGKPSLDATIAALNNLGNIAIYGVDSNGGPVKFSDYKAAAAAFLGVVPSDPCDTPNAATGPHEPECLDFLWRSASSCSAEGLAAPMNIDGTPNQTNVQAANAQGSVANVRSYFQSIFNRTQNSSDFDAQAAAMRSCYNIVIQQPPVDPNACPAPAPLSS